MRAPVTEFCEISTADYKKIRIAGGRELVDSPRMSLPLHAEKTLGELLEQAALERDRERFLELLHEIGLRIAARNQNARPLHTVADRPPMETDTFDIFAGLPGRRAVWKESITGIERARRRLEELATLAPGDYFLFHERSRAVLAQVTGGPAGTQAALSQRFPRMIA
jgi:hypothetical protein